MSNLFHIYDAVVKNIRTGLGSFRDKSSLTALSGQLQTEEAYNTSDIGQRMVDLEAEDGTRAGIRLIPDNTSCRTSAFLIRPKMPGNRPGFTGSLLSILIVLMPALRNQT